MLRKAAKVINRGPLFVTELNQKLVEENLSPGIFEPLCRINDFVRASGSPLHCPNTIIALQE